uniref:Integrator complex subunit 14 C-terminal domain-containing protein n=1 Tax=Acrobeloides nanus TaxID=290746 RepID=A0A914CG80_9BILA
MGNDPEKIAQAEELAMAIVDSVDTQHVFVHLAVINFFRNSFQSDLSDEKDLPISEEDLQRFRENQELNPPQRDVDIIGRNLQTGDQVKDLLKNISFIGCMEYKMLGEFFVKNHPIRNYEVIVITDAYLNYYSPIGDRFSFPALVRFFIVGDYRKEEINAHHIAELEYFAIQCAKEANLFHRYSEEDFMPVFRCDFPSAKSCVEKISSEIRTDTDVTITISPTVIINVEAFPGIPKVNLGLYGFEMYKIPVDAENEHASNFNLVGFTKSTTMLNIESCRLMHSIRPPTTDPQNSTLFHLMAESMGAEGQVALLKHSSGEGAFLKPIRDEITQPWRLVLQFYPSHRIKWTLESSINVEKKKKPLLIVEKSLSYKVTNFRTYWYAKDCTQSDITRLVKHLKRADRIENFYTDLRRMTKYGIATGIESFGKVLSDILEKKKSTFAPENKLHADKVIQKLRSGGWKALLAEIGTIKK